MIESTLALSWTDNVTRASSATSEDFAVGVTNTMIPTPESGTLLLLLLELGGLALGFRRFSGRDLVAGQYGLSCGYPVSRIRPSSETARDSFTNHSRSMLYASFDLWRYRAAHGKPLDSLPFSRGTTDERARVENHNVKADQRRRRKGRRRRD